MRTLIIPDVHEEVTKLKGILSKHKDVDRRIFLGDWFDSFNPEPRHRAAARMLVKLAEDPMNVLLWGNHEFNYSMYDVPGLYCSGYTDQKRRDIQEIVPEWVWMRFQIGTFVDGNWLISHAGVHPSFLSPHIGLTDAWLQDQERACNIALGMKVVHPLLVAGIASGGRAKFGGIDWLRWWEVQPIDGINQVVGHTPSKEVRTYNTETSENYCLDTSLRHVAIIENGKITLHPA